jgi:transcriptional regulator with XRE-family HTH domain
MKAIVLTAEQRRQIDRRRKKTLDRQIYQRLTAVLAVAEGHSPEGLAALLGVDLAQLSQWLRVFGNDGLEALCALAASEPSPADD